MRSGKTAHNGRLFFSLAKSKMMGPKSVCAHISSFTSLFAFGMGLQSPGVSLLKLGLGRPKPKSVFEHVSPTYHPYGNAPTVTRISHHIYHLLVPTLCAQRPPGSNIISSKTHFSFARLPLHLFRIFKALTFHPIIQSNYLDLTVRCSICELSDGNIVLSKFAVSLTMSFSNPPRFSHWLRYLWSSFSPGLYLAPCHVPSHISAFIRCPCKQRLKLEKHAACFCLLRPNSVSMLFWKSECFAWWERGIFCEMIILSSQAWFLATQFKTSNIILDLLQRGSLILFCLKVKVSQIFQCVARYM